MNNPTSWYYAFHKKGEFVNQRTLCDAVRWSSCNLEGQKLKSPDVLSAIQGNPLTIRLLALDRAIQYFDDFKQKEKEIEKIARKQLKTKHFSELSGTWEAENSTFNTMGAPIHVVEISGEFFEIKHVEIQLALYEFFMNYGSIIDRLTYELILLYNIGIPHRYAYWKNLINTQGKYFQILDHKNHELGNLLIQFSQKLDIASKYRNRLAHDGIINCEVSVSIYRSGIMLAENPDDENSKMTVNAVNYCEDTRKEVVNLLNESYGNIYKYFNINGNPPW